jgi:hypothetical protein
MYCVSCYLNSCAMFLWLALFYFCYWDLRIAFWHFLAYIQEVVWYFCDLQFLMFVIQMKKARIEILCVLLFGQLFEVFRNLHFLMIVTEMIKHQLVLFVLCYLNSCSMFLWVAIFDVCYRDGKGLIDALCVLEQLSDVLSSPIFIVCNQDLCIAFWHFHAFGYSRGCLIFLWSAIFNVCYWDDKAMIDVICVLLFQKLFEVFLFWFLMIVTEMIKH